MPGANRLYIARSKRSSSVPGGPVEGPNLNAAPNDFLAGGAAGWSVFSDTVTNNTTLAPDGTTTAATIGMTAVLDFHQHNGGSVLTTDTGQFKHRLYVKAGVSIDFVALGIGNAYAIFRLSTQAVVATSATTSQSVTSVANGFLKLEIVVSGQASTSPVIFKGAVTQPNAVPGTQWTPAGTETFFVWQDYMGTFR